MLELKEIHKSFEPHKILSGFNLTIYPGEFLTLLGPSGCGKTTVLRLIAGFEQPESGEILFNHQLINTIPPSQRNINMVFQSYALFPHLTVFNNIAFGLRMKKRSQTEINERVWKMLHRVKLAEFANRKPHQLSGGQQQRVALARAIVNQPAILLLDEPLSALDYKLRRTMQVELKMLQRQLGITFVFVTHDQEEALSMSDRVVILREGVIEQMGTPREIYERPRNVFVANFVGETNLLEGKVLAISDQQTLQVEIEGFITHVTTDQPFRVGDAIKVLLRPEDLRIETFQPTGSLNGCIEEKIYKGATLDSHIVLPNGKRIIVSEFFDEEHETLDHQIGEQVTMTWIKSWEVVLPNDGKK